MTPVLHRTTGTAILLVGSVVMVLATLEIILRIFAPQIMEVHPNGLWKLSPTRGFQAVPSFRGRHVYNDFDVDVAISEQGIRDRFFGPKPPDVFRILALGDSFTFGFGVEGEASYPKRLEFLLNRAAGRETFEVVNAGMPGYDTRQELAFLREEGLAFQPDLILVGLFGFNDFSDNLLPVNRFTVRYGYLYNNEGLTNGTGGLPIPWKGYLWAYSHAYRFLARRYRMLIGNPSPFPGVANADSSGTRQHEGSTIVSVAEEEKLTTMTRLIKAMSDVGRQHDGPVAILFIPDYKDVQNAVSVWQPIWDRLGDFCEKEGVSVIDLNPVFRDAHRAGRTPELWYPINRHWTAVGHRLAAEAISDALIERHMIPSDKSEKENGK